MHRNERFQEDLWKQSFEILKDHLLLDTIEKYGPKVGDGPTISDDSGDGSGTTAGEEPEAAKLLHEAANQEAQPML